MSQHASFDVVIIGSGFTGLGVAAVFNKKDPSLRIVLVAREERPGGIWTEAANTVKLHQQTYFYALPNIQHDDAECHKSSVHQAMSYQVRTYAEKVARTLGCALLTGEVVGVALDGKQRVVQYRAGGDVKEVRGDHVIQATGFDNYSGVPRLLGVPHEVHSSALKKVTGSLRGKRCLVIGSGKSTIDAAKFLIQEGNKVRFIYRSACAYVRWGFNSPLSDILQWFHPFIHFTMLDESVTPEDWKYDYSQDLDSLDWYVVGDPRTCQQVREKTRGGIIPLRDFLLMNLLLHGYGICGDASQMQFRKEADDTVSCSAFPGEKFDQVVSCTGYSGSKSLFPHCLSAVTPITDLHVHNAWMTGHLLYHIMNDPEKVASWNALASHKHPFPWHGHYAKVRQWCAQHVDKVITGAKEEIDVAMRKASQLPPNALSPGSHRLLAVKALTQLEQLLVSSCKLCIRAMWYLAPRPLSRGLLALCWGHRDRARSTC
ncbi:YUC9 [Symbiodinium pilosum]|uniref:YUC9 protein n=1 Tax=Symbiodinium pilosum TaxID=2952 RepID=A0A812MBH6_SYMPI|nr:YUC9 [Symbiodinium pilosum]